MEEIFKDSLFLIKKKINSLDEEDKGFGEAKPISDKYRTTLYLYFKYRPHKFVTFVYPVHLTKEEYKTLEDAHLKDLCDFIPEILFNHLKSFDTNVATKA